MRSPWAHARIASIDASAARDAPGVVGVFTAADLPDVRIPIRLLPSVEAELALQPPLARDVVRYVGEPVAVVVAATPYEAEDAAEAVDLRLEPLDVVLDPLDAIEAGAPILHPVLESNLVNRLRATHGTDVAALFEAADVVVRDRLAVERHTAVPLETRGLVAERDAATRRLTVWGPAKVKHFNRQVLARLLELPEELIRFIEPDVGGGFGVRGEFYPEDFLVPWIACRIRRPVKWIEDRSEHFVATNHAREQVCDIELAATADGRLLGFRARCLINQGAYARTHGGVLLPQLAVHHLAGPYRWAGFEAEASSVMTNKTPAGTYRGPAQYEPTFFRERMLDRLAVELDLDPVELRRRNLVPVEDMPYRLDLGAELEPITYDSGDYGVTLDRLLDATGYDALQASVASRRRRGETVGVGVAAYIEEGGFGPWEHATVVPEADGRYTAHVGIAALGQGVRTALGQIAADTLGVGFERVEISHRDTDLVREGFGAYASRTTILGGNAIVLAIADLERRARDAAAGALGASPGDVAVSFADARCAAPGGGTVSLAELGCVGEGRFEKTVSGFSMGTCMAVVAVDPETAAATVERLAVCHDVGRVVNPAIVRGQIAGAAVQGVAGALLESLPYDDAGQPLATSFMDYLMPTAAEAPDVETIVLELDHHSPESANPLGVKGCGESGIIGSGAAVANAIAAAIGRSGCEVRTLPVRLDRMDAPSP